MAAEEGRNDIDNGKDYDDDYDLPEEILQMMEEHGNNNNNRIRVDGNNDNNGGDPQSNRNAAHLLPDNIPLAGEEWENIVPLDVTDHPVITAFQASNANFLISDPRIAGNPIIYASEVSCYRQHTRGVLMMVWT